MNIRVVYDNGNYETFDLPPMPFDAGGYVVENADLRFDEMLAAPAPEDMRLVLERSYWTVDRELGEGNQGRQVDVPTVLLDSEQLAGVLAIIVDGMVMVARCDGRLRHWLDPLFVNPAEAGFDVERMTGGWRWPDETMSISRTAGAAFKVEPTGIAPRGSHAGAVPDADPVGEGIPLESLEGLYPGVNDDDDADGGFADDAL